MQNIPWERLHRLPTLRQREDRYIRRVMLLCRGDVTAAAAVLKIGRATLYRRVRELELPTQGQRLTRERLRKAAALMALGAFLFGCGGGVPFASGDGGDAGGASEGGAGGVAGEPAGAAGEPAGSGGEAPTGPVPCDVSTWTAAAFAEHVGEPAELMLDGSETTRWASGLNREPGQWLELELGAGVDLVELELIGEPYNQSQEMLLELDGQVTDFELVAENNGRFVVVLEQATAVTSLRLELTSSGPAWWAISEVRGLCQ